MTAVEYDPETLVFPSQAWFAAYEDRIDADEEYREKSEG